MGLLEKGFLTAVGAFLVYEALSSEFKRSFKESFNLHHGEAGVIATILGALSNDPHMVGVGTGLMATDLQDAEKWFN